MLFKKQAGNQPTNQPNKQRNKNKLCIVLRRPHEPSTEALLVSSVQSLIGSRELAYLSERVTGHEAAKLRNRLRKFR